MSRKKKSSKTSERKLRRSKKKDSIYLEARKVLLNQIELDEDGHFITSDEVRFPLWGAADGESKIRFLGITRKNYYYSSEANNTKAVYQAGKAMANIGRGVTFRCEIEVVSCIVKTHIFYPVVLSFFENDEGYLELSAFSPRTFTSRLAIRLAVRKFNKSSEDDLESLGKDSSFTERMKESRYQRKLEKKQKKDTDDLSVADIDWSSDSDDITEDDLLPENPDDEENVNDTEDSDIEENTENNR